MKIWDLFKPRAELARMWDEEHCKPSEIIMDKAEEIEKSKGGEADHNIILAILMFLDEEVGSSRKRDDGAQR